MADNSLVNDMRKIPFLCEDVRSGLADVCTKINNEMKKFREEMHTICADPWMASMSSDVSEFGSTGATPQNGGGVVGFSRMLNDSLGELDRNVNKNLNIVADGLYGAMYIVAKGHGYYDSDIPKNNKKYVVAIAQLEAMYGTLPDGNAGVPQKGNAAQMASGLIDNLSRELDKCKGTVKSVIQGNLTKAFEEETIQDAANLLTNKVVGEIEKGVNQLKNLVSTYVNNHVEVLERRKEQAASVLTEIGSGTN